MLIAVQNLSTVVTDEDTQRMVAAVARQVRYHFSPGWGLSPVPVVFYGKGAVLPVGADLIAILDDSDQAGALGYHDETPDGQPYGRVFAKPSLDNGGAVLTGGLSVSVTFSHEVLELRADASCNLWADIGNGWEVALEVGDPVESDFYTHDGVAVSNFVLPAWFDPQAKQGARLDKQGTCTTPFEMTAGGYIIVRPCGKEQDVTAATDQPVERTAQIRWGAEYPEWRKPLKEHEAARSARRVAQSAKTAA